MENPNSFVATIDLAVLSSVQGLIQWAMFQAGFLCSPGCCSEQVKQPKLASLSLTAALHRYEGSNKQEGQTGRMG